MDGFDAHLSDEELSDVESTLANNTEGMTLEEIANNKLKHNIAKKGSNSYYYAHAKKAEAPTVRNEPPQLLEKAASNLAKPKLTRPFEKFAWSNGTKIVSVYLTIASADQIPDDKISLTTEKKLFEIRVEAADGLVYAMKIDKLNGEIDGADIKKKADKLVINLKKIEERTWYKLEE
jgi:hypothetical protein